MYEFKARFSGKGTLAVYERNIEDEEAADGLIHFYELFGLREAMWIREVDAHRVKVVVFPTAPPPQTQRVRTAVRQRRRGGRRRFQLSRRKVYKSVFSSYPWSVQK